MQEKRDNRYAEKRRLRLKKKKKDILDLSKRRL